LGLCFLLVSFVRGFFPPAFPPCPPFTPFSFISYFCFCDGLPHHLRDSFCPTVRDLSSCPMDGDPQRSFWLPLPSFHLSPPAFFTSGHGCSETFSVPHGTIFFSRFFACSFKFDPHFLGVFARITNHVPLADLFFFEEKGYDCFPPGFLSCNVTESDEPRSVPFPDWGIFDVFASSSVAFLAVLAFFFGVRNFYFGFSLNGCEKGHGG